jgi:hypothetical protein
MTVSPFPISTSPTLTIVLSDSPSEASLAFLYILFIYHPSLEKCLLESTEASLPRYDQMIFAGLELMYATRSAFGKIYF